MSTKIFYSNLAKTIVVVLAILIIGLLINFGRDIADEAIIESTFEEMDQIGAQYQILLAITLEKVEDDLSLFAESIVDNDVNSDNILDFFTSQSQAHEFINLSYIDINGNGISADNKVLDFSSNDTFINALENHSQISSPHVSLKTSEVVFDLAVPVVENNETRAVLYCEVPVNIIFDIILENKDYTGDIFFLDANLNMIYSTNENHIGIYEIPEEDAFKMGDENLSQMKHNIANKKSGCFNYDFNGTSKAVAYYPVEYTNVALAMNVEVSSLSSEIIRSAEYFDAVGSIIYWLVIALVIYISILQQRSNKRITKLAFYDPLTELPNLVKLKLDMTTVLESNKNKQYTVLVIDIQNFKAINEMFGYEMGDRVLKTVKAFSEHFKEPSLITARIGGDKFVMFAESHFFDDLSFFASQVSDVYDTIIPELADYGGTYKIGRYKIDIGETNFDDIMAKVNLAHVKSKLAKSDFFCDYDDALKNQVKAEADITNKMKTALSNNEFKVFLQPKFSTNNDNLIGAEALVRWIEDDGNMIFPNDFIPLFERNGFIVDIDRHVLESVCMTMRRWMDDGLGALAVSVNCSRLNVENPFFVDGIVAIADKYRIPHEYIEIELTESTTIESELAIEQLFDDLHKHGFKISIDDFGAGYSSLGMLKNLHVDTLKMDRSFFIGGKNAERDDLLIDSIVKMSHNLGMYVVAEGIETAEQIELLKTMNCDAVQGYFYDRPMSIESFEKKYSAIMSKTTKH